MITSEKKVCILIRKHALTMASEWLEHDPTEDHQYIQDWLEGQLDTEHEILTDAQNKTYDQ